MEGRTSQHVHPYALHMRPSALALCTANIQVQKAKIHMFWAISNLAGLHYARFRCALCAALCTALCTQIRCILIFPGSLPTQPYQRQCNLLGLRTAKTLTNFTKKANPATSGMCIMRLFTVCDRCMGTVYEPTQGLTYPKG